MGTTNNQPNLSIKLARKDEFKQAAEEDGTTMSALVAEWVDKYLRERRKPRQKRSQGQE